MRTNLLLSVIVILMITGCTETQVKITPESITQTFNQPYNSVGVRDVPAEKTLPFIFGNLTEAFSNEIRTSGFSKDVYYPFRPDDKVDMILDSQFNVEMDTDNVAFLAKVFLTVFTLFLLEPVFQYDFDYKLAGNINVLKDGKIVKKISATTNVTISTTINDMSAVQAEVLVIARKSLFQQLMQSIGK
jgi:hypothetical protein